MWILWYDYEPGNRYEPTEVIIGVFDTIEAVFEATPTITWREDKLCPFSYYVGDTNIHNLDHAHFRLNNFDLNTISDYYRIIAGIE